MLEITAACGHVRNDRERRGRARGLAYQARNIFQLCTICGGDAVHGGARRHRRRTDVVKNHDEGRADAEHMSRGCSCESDTDEIERDVEDEKVKT